jgi:hypothetical protein
MYSTILRSCWEFVWDVLYRAWTGWFSSMGTTALAVAYGFGAPFWRLLRDSFQGKSLRDGFAAMMRGIGSALKDGAAVTFVLWLGLYLIQVFYNVPRDIRVTASSEVAHPDVPAPGLPRNPKWDYEYGLGKQHRISEGIAKANGIITKEREEAIRDTLTVNVSDRSQVFYVTIGRFNPQAVNPLKKAFRDAKWPEPILLEAVGSVTGMIIGDNVPPPRQDKLYVIATDSASARAVCSALSVRCHPPQESSMIIDYDVRRYHSPQVIIVIKQN